MNTALFGNKGMAYNIQQIRKYDLYHINDAAVILQYAISKQIFRFMG
jgi:hypothetical protein